jgi:hypothetical protein
LLDVASLGSENVTVTAFKFLAFVIPVNDTTLPVSILSNRFIPLIEAIKWVQSQYKDHADQQQQQPADQPTFSDTSVTISIKAATVVIRVKGDCAIVSPTDLPPDTSMFHLRVESCENSFVFVVAVFKSVSVIGCRSCSVFCGICSSVARIEHCESCTVQVAARRVFTSNVVDTDIYILTPKSPIICGECRCMRLAPFNIVAPDLQRMLSSAGLGLDQCAISRWDSPLFLDVEGVFRQKGESIIGTSVTFLPPSLFFPCSVPVPGAPERSLTPIPSEFANQIEDKMRALSAVKARLSQAAASAVGGKVFRAVIASIGTLPLLIILIFSSFEISFSFFDLTDS